MYIYIYICIHSCIYIHIHIMHFYVYKYTYGTYTYPTMLVFSIGADYPTILSLPINEACCCALAQMGPEARLAAELVAPLVSDMEAIPAMQGS